MYAVVKLQVLGFHFLNVLQNTKLHTPFHELIFTHSLTAPDGTHELFVGLTDRVVAAFRWNEASSSLELRQKWILTGQVIYIIYIYTWTCMLIMRAKSRVTI